MLAFKVQADLKGQSRVRRKIVLTLLLLDVDT